MERVTLEKAWTTCYDYPELSVKEKVEKLKTEADEKLAKDVLRASLEMRKEGINWFGSDFEEKLEKIILGEKTENKEEHITVEEWQEYLDFVDKIVQGVENDE